MYMQKRPTFMQKRPKFMQTRPVFMEKEPWKTRRFTDALILQKRPIYSQKRSLCLQKRHMHMHEGPRYMPKKYIHIQIDLRYTMKEARVLQKRPVY